MVGRLKIVSEEPNCWAISVADPHILIAVQIPIHQRDSASIVGYIQATGTRHISKFSILCVQENAMSLASTKRLALLNDGEKRLRVT